MPLIVSRNKLVIFAEKGRRMGDTEVIIRPNGSSWYAWAGIALCSFAILERRALKSDKTHATLSYVVRSHTRKNKARTVAAATAYVATTGWLFYHFWLEQVDPEGFSGPLLSK
jgi:hypothetical protein